MTDDPRWPRASAWLATGAGPNPGHSPGLAVLGVPCHTTSISPTGAAATPAAVRAALARFSTWAGDIDLAIQQAVDLGDIDDPDTDDGERRTMQTVREQHCPVIAIGGDNSLTYAVATGSQADGLITLDAHHDLRDGRSNGSPVQRLITDGLDGRRVVQIGINDFSNSPEYAARARDLGITVISRDALADRPMRDVMAEALELAGCGPAGRVHLDLDVDVCDRAVVPGCPAAAPGGISAHDLRLAARFGARDPRVVSMDIAEVDATADSADGRTVRLAALLVLELAAGVARRY